MQAEPYEFLRLNEVVLFGLDEGVARTLCGACGFHRSGGFDAAVTVERALFRCMPHGAGRDADGRRLADEGRYQSVLRGELFLEDGFTSVLQNMVLKISKPSPSSPALAAEELVRLMRVSGLRASFPHPFGRAALHAGDAARLQAANSPDALGAGSEPTAMLCYLQASVPGTTLRDLLYQKAACEGAWLPQREKIRAFLSGYAENEPWLCAGAAEELPLYPLLTSLALPLMNDLSRLQNEGWQHCDVSPSNVMVLDGGVLPSFRLVDFALLSRVDVPPAGFGTHPYVPAWLGTQGYGETCAGIDMRAVCALVWELVGLSACHPAQPLGVKYPSEDVAAAVACKLAGDDVAHNIRNDDAVLLNVRNEIAQFEKRVLLALQSVLMAQRAELPVAAERMRSALTHEVDTLPARLRALCVSGRRESLGRASENALCIIFAAVIGGIFLVSDPNGLIAWVLGHGAAFALVTMGLAILPAVLGLMLDAPLAWVRYRRRLTSQGAEAPPFSWDAFKRVAKYGDPVGVISKRGVFDLNFDAASYYILCNLLGSLCAITLASAVLALPGVGVYARRLLHVRLVWAVALFTSGVVSFKTVVSAQALPWLPFQDDARENPDNSLFTRFHVWGKVIHLIWVVTWVIVFSYVFIEYGLGAWGMGLPWQFITAEFATVAFLAYSGLSKRAQSVEAAAASSLYPGFMTVSLVCLMVAWVIYPPLKAGLPASIAVSVIAIPCLLFCRWWKTRLRTNVRTLTWVLRYPNSAAVTPLMTIGFLVALTICVALTMAAG